MPSVTSLGCGRTHMDSPNEKVVDRPTVEAPFRQLRLTLVLLHASWTSPTYLVANQLGCEATFSEQSGISSDEVGLRTTEHVYRLPETSG